MKTNQPPQLARILRERSANLIFWILRDSSEYAFVSLLKGLSLSRWL